MDPFIGQIQVFGFNFAPRGWAKCEGQLLAVSQNTALFSLIGTTYGGDGRTTFGLPDLRGRSIVGVGRGPGLRTVTIGERSGAETTHLQKANLPAVNIGASTANASQSAPTVGSVPAVVGVAAGRDFTPSQGYVPGAPNVTLYNAGGNSTPLNNLPPSLGISYCIALVGIFPSRS